MTENCYGKIIAMRLPLSVGHYLHSSGKGRKMDLIFGGSNKCVPYKCRPAKSEFS